MRRGVRACHRTRLAPETRGGPEVRRLTSRIRPHVRGPALYTQPTRFCLRYSPRRTTQRRCTARRSALSTVPRWFGSSRNASRNNTPAVGSTVAPSPPPPTVSRPTARPLADRPNASRVAITRRGARTLVHTRVDRPLDASPIRTHERRAWLLSHPHRERTGRAAPARVVGLRAGVCADMRADVRHVGLDTPVDRGRARSGRCTEHDRMRGGRAGRGGRVGRVHDVGPFARHRPDCSQSRTRPASRCDVDHECCHIREAPPARA